MCALSPWLASAAVVITTPALPPALPTSTLPRPKPANDDSAVALERRYHQALVDDFSLSNLVASNFKCGEIVARAATEAALHTSSSVVVPPKPLTDSLPKQLLRGVVAPTGRRGLPASSGIRNGWRGVRIVVGVDWEGTGFNAGESRPSKAGSSFSSN